MILVDQLRGYKTHLRHKTWCHMVSDTSEAELHEFAARLGLKRSWAQLRPRASAAHYDLTPAKRSLAVELGAVEVTGRELVTRNFDGLRRRGLLALLVVIAACSGGQHDTFTVGDAVRDVAPAACMRLQRCSPFPYDSIGACIADVVQHECAAHDCNAPFAGTEADVDACAAALELQPCVTTEPLPMCLGGSP